MGIARLLEWMACVGLWIKHLPELPKAYRKKWVSESWVSVWAQVLISHFSRKHHGAMVERISKSQLTPPSTPRLTHKTQSFFLKYDTRTVAGTSQVAPSTRAL